MSKRNGLSVVASLCLAMPHLLAAPTSYGGGLLAQPTSAPSKSLPPSQDDIDIKEFKGFVFGSRMQNVQKYKFKETVPLEDPFLGFKTATLMYNGDRELQTIKFEIPKGDPVMVNQQLDDCIGYFERAYGCKLKIVAESSSGKYSDFENDHVRVTLDCGTTSLECSIESIRYRKPDTLEKQFASLSETDKTAYFAACPMFGRTPEEQLEFESQFILTEFCGLKFGSTEYKMREQSAALTNRSCLSLTRFSGSRIRLETPFCGITEARPGYEKGGELSSLSLKKTCRDDVELNESVSNIVTSLMKMYQVVLTPFGALNDRSMWRFHRVLRRRSHGRVFRCPCALFGPICVTINKRCHEIFISLGADWENEMAEELKKQKYANLRIPEYAGFVFGTTNHSGATLCKLNGGYIGVLEPSVDGLTSVIVEQGQKGGINRLYLFSDRINPYRREFFRVELACKLSKKYGFPLVDGPATCGRGSRFCCENFHVEISEMLDRICLEICDHQALIRDDPPNRHRTWSMSTP